MRNWAVVILLAAAPAALPQARPAPAKQRPAPQARSAKSRYDLIMDGKARPGTTFLFTAREIEELGNLEIPNYVPDGLREPRVVLGEGTAEGMALIDFKRLRHAQGAAPSWLDNLIDGERPVKVEVAVRSAGGMCTVELKRLEISKVAATGRVLEILVKSFFLSLFPNAKINEPFELEHHISHVEVKREGLYVHLRKEPRPSAPRAAK